VEAATRSRVSALARPARLSCACPGGLERNGDLDVERVRQGHNRMKRQIFSTALDFLDSLIRGVKSQGERALRQPSLEPQLAQPAAPLVIDYDRYPAAEAGLGWHNGRARVWPRIPFRPRAWFESFCAIFGTRPSRTSRLQCSRPAAGAASIVRRNGEPVFELDALPCRNARDAGARQRACGPLRLGKVAVPSSALGPGHSHSDTRVKPDDITQIVKISNSAGVVFDVAPHWFDAEIPRQITAFTRCWETRAR